MYNTNNLCNHQKNVNSKLHNNSYYNPNNDLDNLQLLCKSCHKEKSMREKEDGSYIRIIETESSFNNQVNEIMNSELSERYAFIEHRVPIEDEEENARCCNAKCCHICETYFNMADIQVRNHDHRTGQFRCAAHQLFLYYCSIKHITIILKIKRGAAFIS